MAKQTIIVMSDSHGDSLIVEEIRDRYLGKVDAIFHDGDSELRPDSPLWEGIQVVRGNMDFYSDYPERLVTQLGPTKIIQTHGHLFDINFNFQKLDFLGSRGRCRHLSLWALACSKCLDGREDPLPKSWFYQSAAWDHQRMSLCPCGD